MTKTKTITTDRQTAQRLHFQFAEAWAAEIGDEPLTIASMIRRTEKWPERHVKLRAALREINRCLPGEAMPDWRRLTVEQLVLRLQRCLPDAIDGGGPHLHPHRRGTIMKWSPRGI